MIFPTEIWKYILKIKTFTWLKPCSSCGIKTSPHKIDNNYWCNTCLENSWTCMACYYIHSENDNLFFYCYSFKAHFCEKCVYWRRENRYDGLKFICEGCNI